MGRVVDMVPNMDTFIVSYHFYRARIKQLTIILKYVWKLCALNFQMVPVF